MPDPAPILLLTRPRDASQRFAAEVGRAVETIVSPLQRIDMLDVVPDTVSLSGIILTSQHGAQAAARIVGLPRQAWCVGDQTARAARQAGFQAETAAGDASALVDLILSRRPKGPLLHIHGEHVRGDVTQRLNAAGVETQQIVAYRQTEMPLSVAALAALDGSRPVVLPLFSPRSATLLALQGPFAAPILAVCISPAVAEAAKVLATAGSILAARPDARSMADQVRLALDSR